MTLFYIHSVSKKILAPPTCGCNMLSQLYHTNSGSNTLWLQHAQPTIPHQLRQQHSVAATCSVDYTTPTQAATLSTCSANYATPTQAATLCDCNMLSQLYHTNSGSNTLWLQHAQPTMPHQLRQQHQHAQPTIPHQLRQQHSVAATCSVDYTTPTQAATLCGCNMLSQLYHTNSGSNTLWLQHAQLTIPHQLRQQHSVTATCSANYTTPTQEATLCDCNMLSQLYHTNSGSNTL